MLDVASLGDSLRVWSFDWHGGFGMYFAVFFVKFSVRLIFFFVFVDTGLQVLTVVKQLSL